MESKDNIKIVNDSHDTNVNKKIVLKVLKKHKIALLIIIFLIMVSSTFAWFLYNKTVSVEMHAHVKAWDVKLDGQEDQENSEVEIELDSLYPGMSTVDTSLNNDAVIKIVNNGEVPAEVSVNINSIVLFGMNVPKKGSGGTANELGYEYEVVETKTDCTTDPDTNIETCSTLILTVNGFPFELSFTLSGFDLDAISYDADGNAIIDSSRFDYKISWDYENDDTSCIVTDDATGEEYNKCDLEDTILGQKSYEFSSKEENADKPSLLINLTLVAVQAKQ